AEDSGDRALVNLGVHDASRLEWTVSLPLPAYGHLSYEVNCQFEIPGTGSRRSPWDQLQGVTRLEGPSTIATSEDTTVDALRERVLALVAMLHRTRDGFARHCRAVVT